MISLTASAWSSAEAFSVAHAFEDPANDSAGVPREPLGGLGALELRYLDELIGSWTAQGLPLQ